MKTILKSARQISLGVALQRPAWIGNLRGSDGYSLGVPWASSKHGVAKQCRKYSTTIIQPCCNCARCSVCVRQALKEKMKMKKKC